MVDPAHQPSAGRSTLADRRADASRQAIVDAAWALSRELGLTGWSLRRLAREIGIAAPSLYEYIDGKDAIYDAMFKWGYQQLDAIAANWATRPDESHREAFRRANREMFAFCAEDPVRYQLMFQRVIPGFVPSEDAYAASLAFYERFRTACTGMGITSEADLDLWTAISTGLTSQQISNDPGGERWRRLVDTAVDLFCDHVGVISPEPPRPEGKRP